MTLSLNKPKLDNLASDIWKSAIRLRGKFKSYEYQNVVLPITLHGQELMPSNYAVCQADLLIKNDRQVTVYLGNSLISHEPHSKEPGDQWPENKWKFHRMLSNPPFGVTWGGKDGYEKEARKLEKSRYRAGMPRVNDGARAGAVRHHGHGALHRRRPAVGVPESHAVGNAPEAGGQLRHGRAGGSLQGAAEGTESDAAVGAVPTERPGA